MPCSVLGVRNVAPGEQSWWRGCHVCTAVLPWLGVREGWEEGTSVSPVRCDLEVLYFRAPLGKKTFFFFFFLLSLKR